MNREKRWNDVGLIFYLALVAPLLLTDSGMKFAESLLNNKDMFNFVAPIVGVLLAFSTSDLIGYLFNTIFIFFWNFSSNYKTVFVFSADKKGKFRFKPEFGGYSLEWKKIKYDFADKLRERANRVEDDRLGNYSPDVVLSYFWQQASKPLVEWVQRRHTVFYKGWTIISTMTIAMLISVWLIISVNLGWTTSNWFVLIVFVVLAWFIAYNAQIARTEAWQLMDLWASEAFDPEIKKAVKEINDSLSSKAEHSKAADFQYPIGKPRFKVMRVDDVKARNAKNDKRLFYFDNDVDIVATTISKKHVETSHFHTANVESYYVVSGKLLLVVDGQNIWLNKGDFITVYPGVCHHFETTSQTVVFLAIKKEPGLMDKQPC